MPENISFSKMLKLIVASEFKKFRPFGFTTVAIVPAFVFILLPLRLVFGKMDTYIWGILVVNAIIFILFNSLLKKYSNKWHKQYAETIRQNKKKILRCLMIYAGFYWGIAIAAVALTNYLT